MLSMASPGECERSLYCPLAVCSAIGQDRDAREKKCDETPTQRQRFADVRLQFLATTGFANVSSIACESTLAFRTVDEDVFGKFDKTIGGFGRPAASEAPTRCQRRPMLTVGVTFPEAGVRARCMAGRAFAVATPSAVPIT